MLLQKPIIPFDLDLTHESIITSHSEPWKPSTVATLIFNLELAKAGHLAICRFNMLTGEEMIELLVIIDLNKPVQCCGHRTSHLDPCRRK